MSRWRPRRRAGLGVLALAGLLAGTGCGLGSHSAAPPVADEKPKPGASAQQAAPDPVPSRTPTPARKAAVPATKTDKVDDAGVVVGFGDSVPAGGGGCDCTNFVQAYANLVGSKTGAKPKVHNFAVSGSTSADVVDQMSESTVKSAVADATTILIMTGANDYNDAFDQASLGADVSKVYPPVADAVQDNVTTAITKMRALNKTAHIVVLDYWASMEDGKVADKDYDAKAMAASVACTESTNAALLLAAQATSATYISTYTAFKGPNGTKDDTNLLQPDGDHPDPAGHQVIAKAIAAVFPDG